MRPITIAGRPIGPDYSVYIVVEAGTTANGDVDTALRMIDAAKGAGADAIKFMIIGADFFMSRRDVEYSYDTASGRRSENMYEMLKKLEFSREEWQYIVKYAKNVGLDWYVTVDYLQGVDLAEELGTPAYKLSSWDTANFPLIRKMARTAKPLVVDTGPTYLSDLIKLVDVVRAEGNDQVLLVHCSHALTDDGLNLRSIPYMQHVFNAPIGFSSDERRLTPDVAAIALGACMLEKRLTLDKTQSGHHHIKALEPPEFSEYVKTIREVDKMLGEHCVEPSVEDLRQRELYFVSIVADVDIPAGTVITEDMLACKRPGNGVMPEHIEQVIGRAVKRDIQRNELLSWDDI
jgi:N,N'-diacetyllegionaminate synthase